MTSEIESLLAEYADTVSKHKKSKSQTRDLAKKKTSLLSQLEALVVHREQVNLSKKGFKTYDAQPLTSNDLILIESKARNAFEFFGLLCVKFPERRNQLCEIWRNQVGTGKIVCEWVLLCRQKIGPDYPLDFLMSQWVRLMKHEALKVCELPEYFQYGMIQKEE